MPERVAIHRHRLRLLFRPGPQHVYRSHPIRRERRRADHPFFHTLNVGRTWAATITRLRPGGLHPAAWLRRVDAVGRMRSGLHPTALRRRRLHPDAGGRDDMGIALGTATAGLDSLGRVSRGLDRSRSDRRARHSLQQHGFERASQSCARSNTGCADRTSRSTSARRRASARSCIPASAPFARVGRARW